MSTQIKDIQPGVELDKLVAVKVMGWEIRKIYFSDQTYTEYYYRDGQQYENVDYPDHWQPSKFIDAAWEVVDKLKIAVIPQSVSAPDHMKYLARIEEDLGQEEIQVFASTAPEAICKAALLAMNGGEQN